MLFIEHRILLKEDDFYLINLEKKSTNLENIQENCVPFNVA